ncbi:MAG: hypothetical protein DVB25_01315 [Verrucomicrobia bacterium]|nr:MAG: hypothetical protein DVB25_01315 [Verrucomicrobiota bacterium]
MQRFIQLIFIGACCAMPSLVLAEVKPAPLFSDGMVLQRNAPVPVWGVADKAEAITVTFCGQKVSATADDQGQWTVTLAKLQPGGPFPMTVAGNNTITFAKVFVGDVWLCGGQSNMDMKVDNCDRADDAKATTTLNLHLSGGQAWSLSDKSVNGGFSGTGYWFGRYLAEQMQDLHIGLIQCAVGGSKVGEWSPGGVFYRAQLQPLMPYALKGVVWYQGESNAGEAYRYSQAMETMMAAWRKDFRNPVLPFIYMQLPRFNGPPKDDAIVNPTLGWPLLQEAQVFNLTTPNTAMAVYFDCTDGELHPKNKPDGGKRLALAALAKVYGRKPAEDYLCPVLRQSTLKDGTLTLEFDNAAKELMVKDSPAIRQFIIICEDGTQKLAKARVNGNKVIVDLTGEKGLPEVYYSFSDHPLGNLFNTSGLPVSPFRLAKRKHVVDACSGSTLTIHQDIPFGANALKPGSYRIAGYTITKAEYYPNSAVVRLTVDKPWTIGEKHTLQLPGFKQWDGKTEVAPIEFSATPAPLVPAP